MMLNTHLFVLTGHGRWDKQKDCTNWPARARNGRTAIRIGACRFDNTILNTRATWVSKSVRDGPGLGIVPTFENIGAPVAVNGVAK